MRGNETAQSSKVHLFSFLFFFFIWPFKSNPFSPGYLHTLGCPSAALTAPSHPTTDPKGLTHKLAGQHHHHHPFSSLASAKSSPVSISSCKVSACPQHLLPSGIFCYILPHQITIMILSSVQSPSSTDRVKLKVPMILESCKVIMKGSRKKPATLSRHEGPLKRRKAC